jgi:hypothetical protein
MTGSIGGYPGKSFTLVNNSRALRVPDHDSDQLSSRRVGCAFGGKPSRERNRNKPWKICAIQASIKFLNHKEKIFAVAPMMDWSEKADKYGISGNCCKSCCSESGLEGGERRGMTPYVDRPPPGWFVLDVMQAATRSSSWVARF